MTDPLVRISSNAPTTAGSAQAVESVNTDKRVLIALMPWAPPYFPGLGPALVRSVLLRDRVACDIAYGNLIFSKLHGGDPFLERQLGKVAMSEIAFTPFYFGTTVDEAVERLQSYISIIAPDRSLQTIDRYKGIIENAGKCLDQLISTIAWEKYDIVGFSVMMQQTVASLALAKRIKELHPHIKIIFGGPNVSRPMGLEMIRRFPEIDFALEGEADGRITPLVNQIRSRPQGPYDVLGLFYRDQDGNLQDTGQALPFHDLNGLPVPDYRPYMEQLDRLELNHIQPYLPFETSRGCWWGEKHHCTFCGIDDNVMKFRSKSADRILHEIMELAAENQSTEMFAVDSIINNDFYRTLLPRIGHLRDEQAYDFNFFFECKSNIRREIVQAFRYGGVNTVQPGLESFNDHILKLMDKGTTAVRQIQCLKFLAENDIVANWNLIYANPGETIEDYRETIAALPFLYHLGPLHSEGMIRMQVNRFAPYHNTPEKYDLTNLRPESYYKEIFPRAEIDLDQLAIYFEYDHRDHDNEELKAAHLELHEAMQVWTKCHRRDSLLQFRGPGFVQIVDRRVFPLPDGGLDEPRHKVTTLEEPWSDIFSFCDELHTESEVIRVFSERVTASEIQEFLDHLVAERLVYRSSSGQIINLPLLKEARERFQPVVQPNTSYSVPAPIADDLLSHFAQ